ncbi:oxidoreductase [Philodulcilactobacillus myokoensis]|uniref:Oxidoreductase n=1 Tax=Philodulcilactobacillus myokoensis TaxID=2929573 RepID=A0A9W6B483_9LACO|nr:aldo/keto reductase [Philodulcilactobacillus myokoensis]GLB47369.1 oxidoreductase [Philodulcilactobacillus myokoensis]
MVQSIKDTTTLADGTKMPMEGFGTYKITEQDQMNQAVKAAFEDGYRLFDTAQFYNNEQVLGNAIKKLGINREHIFITTKIPEPKQGYESTLKAVDESLTRLQTDYLNLVLIHWPIHSQFFNTWRALEDAKKAGKIKSIGVSNYHRTHLELLKTQAKEMPVVNQIENHPYLTQEPLVKFDQQSNIQNQAWSPLGRGLVLHDETIQKIAKQHNKSIAQVVLRWHLQRGIAIIPKSTHPARIKANADLYDFNLSDDEMKSINKLNRNHRTGDDPELVYEIEHQY